MNKDNQLLKEKYLNELKIARFKYSHDFPKYLKVTKEIINKYEGGNKQCQ